MGAASRQALRSAIESLDSAKKVTVATGEQLLTVSRTVQGSAQLRGILADDAIPAPEKTALVGRVFPGLGSAAAAVLSEVVGSRWSDGESLVAGVEELGIRATARGDGHTKAIERELFAFSRIVAGDAQLELALGSKLADPVAKAGVVDALLGGKAHEGTIAIVDHLVRSPRGRRIGSMFAFAADVVSAAGGRRIATVTTAVPLTDTQQARLAAALAERHDTDFQLNLIVDPDVLGGVRVQFGGDVIDGTVAARMIDLRLQLAG
ncbi:MAG: F0F1 ATP synthase subunit delta [Micrococcales bacterium]|nr:F0F1 ATP synthase subunit delta [Micrococcales bacterium]